MAQPHTWNEICAIAQQRWGVTAAAAQEDHSPGKRISNAKLRAELGYVLRHPDLYEALALIESADGVEAQDGQNGFQQGPRREGTGGVPFLTRPPRAAKTARFPMGYVEDSGDPRTTLEASFHHPDYRRRAITAKHTSKLLMAWARMPGSRLPVFSYIQAQRTPLHRTLMKPTNP